MNEGRGRQAATKVVFERPAIHGLDRFRDEMIMRDGVAITAMIAMISASAQSLVRRAGHFRPEESEQLAWLLGEPALRFPVDADGASHPDPERAPTFLLRAIGTAVRRAAGEPLPEALERMIAQRVRLLRAQRLVCEAPFDREEERRRRSVGLLPDAEMLDRILRYETHADRSLGRALDTLAKLRGATVESVAASLRRVGLDGLAVEVRGERTRWAPGAALDGD